MADDGERLAWEPLLSGAAIVDPFSTGGHPPKESAAMNEALIDAGQVLGDRERALAGHEAGATEKEIEGARGSAKLKAARRTWPAGSRTFFAITGVVMAGVVTLLFVKARRVQAESQTQKRVPAQVERVARTVPELKLAGPAVPRLARARSAATSEPAGVPTGSGSQPSEAELVQQRRLAKGFGAGDAESGTGAGGPQPPSPPAVVPPGPSAAAGLLAAAGGKRGGLEEKLEAPELRMASAGMLPDRDYLLTQGAMIDCVLETKLISTVSGMSSCHLTRDIYSANGRVVLLDRGSKVVGRYQGGGMQQGDARIFVVWTRVETPNGVVIELQSPGTGALGEAGVGGYVDTHFWDRFGSAILLSIIQDGADAAAARAAGPGANNTITLSNQATATKEVVAKSMEPTLNIPPTIYKNQGERVGIFVARDLDFRSVYGLERTARAE